MIVRVAFVACAALAACTPPRAPVVPSVTLQATDGASVPLDAVVHSHRLTVITFFSADCPCQRAHDERLRALEAKDAARDVAFVVVDSEAHATLDQDAAEARLRGYAIVQDDGGALARALDAEYATFTVVVDRGGHVVYRGGFDSDRSHLKEDRTPYLEDALDDLLAGRPPRVAATKTLGCTLQLR